MFTSHVRADNTGVFYYPDPHCGSVFVTGSFCGWETPGYPLRRINNGWAGEVPNFPDGEHEYKFVVDGNWVNDPHNVLTSGQSGGENSVINHRNNKGNVYHFDFYSPAIGESRGYCIYLPPSYFLDDERYSTIFMLHGLLDWEYTWIHKGLLHLTLDHLRSQGRIGEMIVVMPRENGEFHQGDGRFADYLARDLVGHIDVEFKTMAHSNHRAIDGLSTGAFTSSILGLSRPYMFNSVGSMSGAYDRRVFETLRFNADAVRRYGSRFHISCGTSEPCGESSMALTEALRNQGIYVEFYENPGPHDWELWGPSAYGNVEFHWWSFQKKH